METTGQQAGPRLSELLRVRHHHILETWRAEVGRLPAAQGLEGPVLMNHMPEVLACIADVVDERSPVESLSRLPEVHALDRLDRGFDLRAVVTEFSLLREVIMREWSARAGDSVPVEELRRLDGAIAEAIAVSADRYSRARERTLQALDRISQAALGTQDLDTFLGQLMLALLETTESVDFVSVFLRDGDRLVLRSAQGLPELLSSPSSLRMGEGFVGAVAASGAPLFVRDAAQDRLVVLAAKRQSGMRALYGVPLMAEGRVIGVAEMGSRTSFEFSATDRLLFRTMAQRASALVVQAQLVARERQARQEAEEAAARAQLLAVASEILSSSLDGEQILQNVATLAVPRLADWVLIDRVTPDGRLEGAAAAHADARQQDRLEALRKEFPPSLRRSGAGQALLEGRPMHIRVADEATVRAYARDDRHSELLWGLGIGSLISVPVRGRRGVGATVTLVRSGKDRAPFEAVDVQMVEQLARLIGLSLENARLLGAADAERARLRGVLQGLPVAVVLAEAPSGRVLQSNDAFLRIAGRSPPAARRVEDYRVFQGRHPDGRRIELHEWPLPRALRGETVENQELLMDRPDGTHVHILASAAPIRDHRGELSAAVVAFMDISERKRAEEFERRLAAIVGHDLKNPLQAVLLTTQLLLGRNDLTEPARKGVRRIRSAAERMGRIVSEVLDFARVQLGGGLPVEREPVDVCELLGRMKEEFDATHPGRLVVECPPRDLRGMLDPDRVGQVLSNLVGNALAHGADGRPVAVRVRRREDGVELTVHNEGPPIPKEALPKLFDPFVRPQGSRGEGLGLGLFITHHIVQAHGGQLDVRSDDVQGTSFTVRLPLGVEGP